MSGNIGVIGCPYYDYLAATVVEGFTELGYKVYDLHKTERNYMIPYQDGINLDLIFILNTDDHQAVSQQHPIPKIIINGHDMWANYYTVPDSPVKPYNAHNWVGNLAFVRDLDQNRLNEFNIPVFPIEFGIEKRYLAECSKYVQDIQTRPFDIAFFGTPSTARRQSVLDRLGKEFKCNFGDQRRFTESDQYWSKWVNGRFSHVPAYYEALCSAKTVLSPWGAGPSCGRTWEAYAAQTIPLIQKYPDNTIQMNGFVDGENCILWSTSEELISKLREVLSSEELLLSLLEKSKTFALEKCLTKHRAEYILEKIDELGLIKKSTVGVRNMLTQKIDSYVGNDIVVLKGECSEFIQHLYRDYKGGDELLDSMTEQNTDAFTKYKKVLYDIANYIQPKTVVELGVREARSSDAFTRVVSKTGGKVYSFDPVPIGHPQMGPYNNFWEFHPLGGETGYDQFGSTIKDIDLLFIDTDPHSKEQMDMWLSKYWINNVRKGGFIVADDVSPQHDEAVKDLEYINVLRTGRDYGVLSAIVEFVEVHCNEIEYAFSVYNNHCNGFAVIKLI